MPAAFLVPKDRKGTQEPPAALDPPAALAALAALVLKEAKA